VANAVAIQPANAFMHLVGLDAVWDRNKQQEAVQQYADDRADAVTGSRPHTKRSGC